MVAQMGKKVRMHHPTMKRMPKRLSEKTGGRSGSYLGRISRLNAEFEDIENKRKKRATKIRMVKTLKRKRNIDANN